MKNRFTLLIAILIANFTNAQSLEQGKTEFQNENFKRAKRTFLAVNKANPSSFVSLYLGNTYMKLDENDSALYYYQLSAAGTDAYAHVAKARLAATQNKDQALMQTNIDKALSISRKREAEVFFQLGYITYQPKATNVSFFVPYFEEAKNLAPENEYYTLMLGDIYLAQHEGGKAMDQYESVTDKNPNNVMGLIRVGRLFYSAMNYTKAIEYLEKANSINDGYGIVHKELGELYYLNRQYDKASSEFKRYLELNDNDSKAKATYGGFLFQLKEYQKAVDEITPFSKADSTNFIYYRILAYSNYEIKKMKEAQTAMNNFWKYAENSKVIGMDYIYSGRIASANGDTANAISYLKNAVALDSNDADLQSELGKAYFTAKRNKEAAAAYERRVHMQQEEPSPLDYYYLGRAYLNIDEYVNADSAFAQFVKMQPKSPDGYLWRAKANVELEDKANLKGFANAHYLKYIELASADVARNKSNLISAYNYLGFVALAQKDNATAKMYFSKILEVDPGNVKAQEEIKRLK